MNMRIYIYLAVVLTLPVYVHAQTISMDKTPYPEQYMGGTIGLVGTIGGEFQVSPSGAAQYDVTFDLPEGAGGFSPEIGIAYDSRRGDGVLGHGFYLKGLSMITRTRSDLYHDGSVSGVSMTDADHFALDGMRLLYKGDNLYVPELNNLWRIKTNKSGNPNYFTIENGEGSTMYYGSTMDGRISGSGEGSYLSWLLNKVEDANGNYYTIEYKNALGEFYVDNIKYGGNVAAGVSPAYTLKFTYSPREKCAVFYVLGNHYHTSHLLTSVEVFFGENFLRSYDFTYKTNVGKTLPYLKSIKLRGTDNIGFKSTSFEWSETPDATLLPGIEQPVFTGDNIGLYIGDFDGDGLRDYLEVANNANNKTQKIWRLFKNKGNGKFEYTNWGFLNNEHTRLLIGDFNAYGKYDFIEEYKPGATYSYIQYTSDGNNFTKKYPVITTEQRETIPIVADLNGDCMDDLILCYKNSSDYKIMFCHLTGSYRTVNGKVTNNWDNVVTADFSGDGMCDIINIHKDGFDYFRSAGSSQLEKVGIYWFFKSSDYIYPGDFNGDGNTDILKIDSSRKNITIYTSTGTGFSSNLPTNFVNPADYEVFIADINGDGMDDLYAVKRSGEYAATKAFINENYGTSFAMYQGPKSPPVSDCQYLFTADFTGNGKADIFFSGRTSTSTINRKFTTIYLQPDGHLPLLSKVTDEYGNYHSITYTNMYDAAVHEVTTDFSFPLRASRLPVSIVHEVLRNNGIGGENIIKSANRHAVNAAKIIAGLFVTDPNKGFFGRALELFSRFTFQATQTMVGYMYSNIANMAGRVYNVSHAYGATAVANSWNSKSAVTLGSFILGREDLRADAGHPTFQHEYGHYLQSQRLGPAYWPAVALPSVFNVMYGSDHSYRSYEMNANYLAFRYFNENVTAFYKTEGQYSEWVRNKPKDYFGWYFGENPLLPGGKYVDYEIDEQKERMREATSIKVNFWNYFLPFIPNIR